MRYACLVYLDEAELERLDGPERARLRHRSAVFEDELRASGHLVGVEPLQPVRTATTVRVRDGRARTLDGPATRTAEQLSRVLVVEARDLNEALRLAAQLPAGRLGSIEVRPLCPVSGNAAGQSG